jgi:hypothetical protein
MLDSSYSLFTMMMEGFSLHYHRREDLNSSFKIYLRKAHLIAYEYELHNRSP